MPPTRPAISETVRAIKKQLTVVALLVVAPYLIGLPHPGAIVARLIFTRNLIFLRIMAVMFKAKKNHALMAGVLAGIASPASIGMPVAYPRLNGDDMSRIQGDVMRVGSDFSSAMKKYEQTIQTPSASVSKAN